MFIYILLQKEDHMHSEVDHLFRQFVLPEVTYALPLSMEPVSLT